MKVRVGRRRLDFDQLEGEFRTSPEHVVALGPGMPEPSVAFGFADWKGLVTFMKGRPGEERVARMDERRRKLRRREHGDNTAVRETLARRLERVAADMRDLARRTRLPLNSKELFLRATSKADPLEGPIFDPAALFTGTSFAGLQFFVGYPGSPDFTWTASLNNNVSSLRGNGALSLYSATWFRGSSRLFLGDVLRLGFYSNTNLATVGFNNVASSALVD